MEPHKTTIRQNPVKCMEPRSNKGYQEETHLLWASSSSQAGPQVVNLQEDPRDPQAHLVPLVFTQEVTPTLLTQAGIEGHNDEDLTLLT